MLRLIAIDFSLLSPTSPCELSEREVTFPSNLKVAEALDNYSLVFVIFINFFGQLKDWVGQVLFLVTCPKGQVEKYVNVEAWTSLNIPVLFIEKRIQEYILPVAIGKEYSVSVHAVSVHQNTLTLKWYRTLS